MVCYRCCCLSYFHVSVLINMFVLFKLHLNTMRHIFNFQAWCNVQNQSLKVDL